MSSAEDLRAGLGKSASDNRQQTAMTDESRVLLTGFLRGELRDELRIAVAEGIAAAMTEKNAKQFMRTLIAEAQQMATEKTGEVVGGAVVAVLKKAMLFLFLGSLVYAVGGWSALASLAKFLKVNG